jgi:hypothetical protein
MNRAVLIAYQLLTGISDTLTGVLLITAPAFTLAMMHVHSPIDAYPYLSFIGAFVLSVGLSCLIGVYLMVRKASKCTLDILWLLTAITRASVAIFVISQVLANALEAGWLMVAITDGSCVLFQAMGLRKGWLAHVA